MRILPLLAAALFCVPSISRAQAAAKPADTTSTDLVRVFLDCNTSGCDDEFFRTEITWVNFVRDRTVSQVHVLVTSEQTGSGGRKFTITFDGSAPYAGVHDSLTLVSRQGDTDDEIRRAVSRVLTIGLLRYARTTQIGELLQVSMREKTAGEQKTGAQGAHDPWNLWVYSVSANAFGNGDANYGNLNVYSRMSAGRVSEAWKINLGLNMSYSESRYKLTDGTLHTFQHSNGGSAQVVKSVNGHWSAGLSLSANRSKYENYSLALSALPAVEWDLFPYKESTRRQLLFRYGVGFKSFKYDSVTIYDKTYEARPAHELNIASDLRQKWGSLSVGISGSQYLDDFAKRSLSMNGGINWRVVRGLEFNIDGYYAVTRDQLNIPRGTVNDEDILVRLHQLQSGYSYFVSFGLSYTFGSIFNNVVNPRFGRGGGCC